MWGKPTERKDWTQTNVISEPKELNIFLATLGIEVTNLALTSDDEVWISWKHAAEEHVRSLRHTNGVFVAYVTTGARFHLYSNLDGSGEKSIYCDIYSIIYIQLRDEPNLI